MTSRTLSLNVLKHALKEKGWLCIFLSILFILAQPVYMLAQMESYIARHPDYSALGIETEIMNYLSFGFSNCLALLLAIVLAILCFNYLFSRKKLDLYHSIPLKRTHLFFTQYFSGILLFLVIFTLSSILKVLAVCVRGYLTVEIIQTALSSYGLTLVYFLAFYHIAILAVMLTGQTLVCIAACGVLYLYIPAIRLLVEAYLSFYTNTFYSGADPSLLLRFISPVSSLYYNLRGYNTDNTLVLAVTILVSFITLAFSMYLYKKRPSESASKALAFSKTGPIIRFLIVIPVALTGGLFIAYYSPTLSVFWFWLAFLVTGILMHCIMEIIYAQDFKAALRHKIQLVVSLGLGVVIVLSIQNDWIGYDSYLPEEDELASVSIAFRELTLEYNYYDIPEMSYKGTDDYLMHNMSLTDVAPVLSLARTAIDNPPKTDRNSDWNYWTSNDGSEELTNSFLVKYTLNSGREVYRYYHAPLSLTYEDTATIFDSKEYKEAFYQLSEFIQQNVFTSIDSTNEWNDQIMNITGDKVNEFLKTYNEELMELSFDSLCNDYPVMSLYLHYPYTNPHTTIIAKNVGTVYGYHLYPSFTKTLALLESYGVDSELMSYDIDAAKVEWIRLMKWTEDETPLEVTYQESNPADAQKIQELSACLIPYNLANSQPFNASKYSEEQLSIEMSYRVSAGITMNIAVASKDGTVPAFVENDLK